MGVRVIRDLFSMFLPKFSWSKHRKLVSLINNTRRSAISVIFYIQVIQWWGMKKDFSVQISWLFFVRFDLRNSNVSDPSLEQFDLDQLADVVSFPTIFSMITNWIRLNRFWWRRFMLTRVFVIDDVNGN